MIDRVAQGRKFIRSIPRVAKNQFFRDLLRYLDGDDKPVIGVVFLNLVASPAGRYIGTLLENNPECNSHFEGRRMVFDAMLEWGIREGYLFKATKTTGVDSYYLTQKARDFLARSEGVAARISTYLLVKSGAETRDGEWVV